MNLETELTTAIREHLLNTGCSPVLIRTRRDWDMGFTHFNGIPVVFDLPCGHIGLHHDIITYTVNPCHGI